MKNTSRTPPRAGREARLKVKTALLAGVLIVIASAVGVAVKWYPELVTSKRKRVFVPEVFIELVRADGAKEFHAKVDVHHDWGSEGMAEYVAAPVVTRTDSGLAISIGPGFYDLRVREDSHIRFRVWVQDVEATTAWENVVDLRFPPELPTDDDMAPIHVVRIVR